VNLDSELDHRHFISSQLYVDIGGIDIRGQLTT